MKRLALLLAAVLLTGCAAPASVPASSNIPEQTAETSSLLYWTPYTSIPNGSGYFSVFHSADDTPLLSRYDFTDMTRHIVCDVPGCTHADSTCPAYLDDYTIVCVPDAVYTFLQQLDEYGTPSGLSTMMRRDPDGTDPQPVGTLSSYWFFFGADETYLYGFCDNALGRVRRTDGQEQFLAQAEQSRYMASGHILGVWNGQFVTVYWGDSSRSLQVNLLSREGVETPVAVLESSISPTGWMEYHGAVLAGSAVCTATPDGTVTEYDLSTGETRVRTTGLCAAVQQGNPPVELTSVADGYLLATVWTEHQGEQWFLISPDGDCQPFSLTVEERDFADALGATDVSMPKIVQPVCETSRGLLVQHARQYFFKESHASDGTPVTFETFATRYALIDPEDYLASRPVYREFTEISQQ